MIRHLYANLWLLLLTLLLCSVAYPLLLLGIAQMPFLKHKADGSLLLDADGKVVGSRLEAQAFDDDKFFWPRPSAASYVADGTKGGGSNLSPNNPDLRQRVEFQTLGALLRYGPDSSKARQLIGPDIEAWFAGKKGVVALWAEKYPGVAQAWAKDNKQVIEFIKNEKGRKLADHVQAWLKKNAKDEANVKDEELAVPFLTWFSESYAAAWPTVTEMEVTNKQTGEKGKGLKLEPIKTGKEIRNLFNPMWREEHPNVDLDPVPADLVTVSGSGLDPHITLKGAMYQFDRVADEWARLQNTPKKLIVQRLHRLLDAHTHAPLGGLAGVDLVNIVEVNLALQKGEW